MQNFTKKIILLADSYEKSTENVMDWLYYYKASFERKNTNAHFSNYSLKINNLETRSSNQDDIIWYRRGYQTIIPNQLLSSPWIDYLKKEQLPVLEMVEKLNPNRIGSYHLEFNNNKLLNLQYAKEVGLLIPNTLVTNNKVDLLNFIEKDKRYITKSLIKEPTLETEDMYYSGVGTVFLEVENIDEIFAPSLVQEYIEKEVEIRVFFFEEEFYAMAIFSQNDTQTLLDYRNYDKSKPNRNVPFELPKNILEKIKLFAKKINCSNGSIDIILTSKNEFVFLEINPMGQYHWLSESCNYYIDKKIAEKLIVKANG